MKDTPDNYQDIAHAQAIEASKFIVIPHLIVQQDSKILLMRRSPQSKIFQGYWHCPTGKREHEETPLETILREAHEETGLLLNASDIKLETVLVSKVPYFFDPTKIYRDINFFFVIKNPSKDPINKESHLHDAMEWFDTNKLPYPMIPTVKAGIEQYVRGDAYGEFELDKSAIL